MPPTIVANINPPLSSDDGRDAVQASETAAAAMEDLSRIQHYEEPSGFITVAVVISMAPTTGVYRVSVGKGMMNDYAILLNQSSDRVYGYKDVTNFSPGTYVLIFVPGKESDIMLPNIILGSANVIALEPDNEHLFNKYADLIPRSGVSSLNRPDQKEQTLSEDAYPLMLRDFSYGRPLDTVPGEWCKINALGGGMLLNDFTVFMKASDMARVECFLFDNTVRITGEKLITQNAAYDERTYYDRYGISSIRSVASSINEGLGALSDNPALVDSESSDPKLKKSRVWTPEDSDTVRGYFSMNILEGYLVDGSYEYMTVPSPGDYYKNDAVSAPATLSVEKRPDGVFRVKAAKELSLEKTVYIVAPKEKEDSDTEDTSAETVFEREAWSENHEELGELAFLGKQILDEYDEHEATKNSFAGAQTKDYWDVKTSREDVYKSFNAATDASFSSTFTLAALTDELPHYEEPPRRTTILPFVNADGQRTDGVEVFDVSTAIRQLEDGSIVISGGYGEEIRFFKGNIYLTCPGDIVEQPGRDKVTFAPRHNIQKSCKGVTEITSDNAISIVAAGNVQLTAAASGKQGTMLIENKSESNLDIAAFTKDGGIQELTGAGGGIVLKSASNLAVLSKHNYIGYGGSSNYHATTTQINSGRVITNTGVNAINIEKGGLFAVTHLSGGSLSLTNSIFEVLTKRVDIGTSAVTITKGIADFTALDHKGEDVNVVVSTSDPVLDCKGPTRFKSITAVTGNIDSIIATGLRDKVGDAGEEGYATIPNQVGEQIEGQAEGIQPIFEIFKDSVQESMENLKKIGTVFPGTLNYLTEGFYLPVSTWQAIITGGTKWKELEVKGVDQTTMSFPGKDRWKEKGSLKGYANNEIDEKDLATQYIINSAMNLTQV